MHQILLVDDDQPILAVLTAMMRRQEYQIVSVQSGEDGLKKIKGGAFDLVVTDMIMPGMDGLEMMQAAFNAGYECPFIFITGNRDVETAIKVMKAGAFDYVVKPLKVEILLDVVHRALQYLDQKLTMAESSTEHKEGDPDVCIAINGWMREVCEALFRFAVTPVPVLIAGERGVGKSFIARRIVGLSPRKGRRFIEFDAARIPWELQVRAFLGPGLGDAAAAFDLPATNLFEATEGGTLFLERIESSAPEVQDALHDIVQDHRLTLPGRSPRNADIRLLAGTDVDLRELVARGVFNARLQQRLELIRVYVPPLRKRREDILPLAQHFISLHAKGLRAGKNLDPQAQQELVSYPWPGNVSELQKVVGHACTVANGEVIGPLHLPEAMRKTVNQQLIHNLADGIESLRGQAFNAFLRDEERTRLARLYKQFSYDKEKTAQAVGISVRALERKLEEVEQARTGNGAIS